MALRRVSKSAIVEAAVASFLSADASIGTIGGGHSLDLDKLGRQIDRGMD